jgi:hypothetical protein
MVASFVLLDVMLSQFARVNRRVVTTTLKKIEEAEPKTHRHRHRPPLLPCPEQ